jgi:hypothetical protein
MAIMPVGPYHPMYMKDQQVKLLKQSKTPDSDKAEKTE